MTVIVIVSTANGRSQHKEYKSSMQMAIKVTD